MIAIIEDGTISSKIAKKVFVHLAKNGGGAREYVEKAGLVQISDPEVLIPIIHQVFADNEAAVADFKSGKRNADKAFTGFLMKATKGQANPQVALKLLAQEFGEVERRVIDKEPAERLVFICNICVRLVKYFIITRF